MATAAAMILGRADRLACPRCRAPVRASARPEPALTCSRCAGAYAIVDGVPQFAEADAFYEREGFVSQGMDYADSMLGRLKLYFARHHYLHEVARQFAPGARVVEIGCGGGSRFLARRYAMIGVDISTASAARAAEIYEFAVRANAAALPLPDASVDGLISSFVLEHLEGDAFDAFFAEARRVLRPGGRMVHYFDLENDAPFTRWAKRHAWYDSLFIEERGHHCLRRAEIWADAFHRHGFRTLRTRFSCKSWLQDASIWGRLRDPRVEPLPRLIGRAVRAAEKLAPRLADVAMATVQDLIEPLLPDAWASKVIWSAGKNADRG